jgi:hypothetical protein
VVNIGKLKMKINRENKMLNIPSNNEVAITEKEIKEFKKKNKKYLAARHETDKHIKVTKPGQDLPVLEDKSR